MNYSCLATKKGADSVGSFAEGSLRLKTKETRNNKER